jgi:hypothetical protein
MGKVVAGVGPTHDVAYSATSSLNGIGSMYMLDPINISEITKIK